MSVLRALRKQVGVSGALEDSVITAAIVTFSTACDCEAGWLFLVRLSIEASPGASLSLA